MTSNRLQGSVRDYERKFVYRGLIHVRLSQKILQIWNDASKFLLDGEVGYMLAIGII